MTPKGNPMMNPMFNPMAFYNPQMMQGASAVQQIPAQDPVNNLYVTTGIRLARAKKANNNGVYSRYITITVQDDYSFGATPKRLIFFEDDIPGVYEILAKYPAPNSSTDPNAPIVVDLRAFKESEDFTGRMAKIMEWRGGAVVPYKFRKGLCYQNDDHGNIVYFKGTQTPVSRDGIEIFVQQRGHRYNEYGQLVPDWVSGLSPEVQGARIENAFYRNPVVSNDELPTTAPGAEQLLNNAATQAAPQVPPQAPNAQMAPPQAPTSPMM